MDTFRISASLQRLSLDMAGDVSHDELARTSQTLNEALAFAAKNQGHEATYRIARDACIQRFEYCIELSWKTAMRKLGSQTKFPKQAVREMARSDLIDSADAWLGFIEARNATSHSYDENVAQRVFEEIQKFAVQVQELQARLGKMP